MLHQTLAAIRFVWHIEINLALVDVSSAVGADENGFFLTNPRVAIVPAIVPFLAFVLVFCAVVTTVDKLFDFAFVAVHCVTPLRFPKEQ